MSIWWVAGRESAVACHAVVWRAGLYGNGHRWCRMILCSFAYGIRQQRPGIALFAAAFATGVMLRTIPLHVCRFRGSGVGLHMAMAARLFRYGGCRSHANAAHQQQLPDKAGQADGGERSDVLSEKLQHAVF